MLLLPAQQINGSDSKNVYVTDGGVFATKEDLDDYLAKLIEMSDALTYCCKCINKFKIFWNNDKCGLKERDLVEENLGKTLKEVKREMGRLAESKCMPMSDLGSLSVNYVSSIAERWYEEVQQLVAEVIHHMGVSCIYLGDEKLYTNIGTKLVKSKGSSVEVLTELVKSEQWEGPVARRPENSSSAVHARSAYRNKRIWSED